ncbi:antibiotic biosynthesis monooxygenase [Sinosporangium siamense]|uniref:ABM domain-containing protein n=1 Tax=Sinosporangium siamense TaxID=1367973 RepID=A0A919RGT2_9ACTN|nr:antibiotic biosynthesis monooxygenase [Sinosporangium siamense]GII93606.1 hypothetical protein Ssi02_38370 [Sinosporangium siamense]
MEVVVAVIAFAGALLAAIATGALIGRLRDGASGWLIGWSVATASVCMALGVVAAGHLMGFGPAFFRIHQLAGSFLAPVFLAAGLVQLLTKKVPVKFATWLLSIAFTVLAVGVLMFDPLNAPDKFGAALPDADAQWKWPPAYLLLATHITVALVLIGILVMAVMRGRSGDDYDADNMHAAAVLVPTGLALLASVRFALPGPFAVILLAATAAAVWYSVLRPLAPYEDDDEEDAEIDSDRWKRSSRSDEGPSRAGEDAPRAGARPGPDHEQAPRGSRSRQVGPATKSGLGDLVAEYRAGESEPGHAARMHAGPGQDDPFADYFRDGPSRSSHSGDSGEYGRGRPPGPGRPGDQGFGEPGYGDQSFAEQGHGGRGRGGQGPGGYGSGAQGPGGYGSGGHGSGAQGPGGQGFDDRGQGGYGRHGGSLDDPFGGPATGQIMPEDIEAYGLAAGDKGFRPDYGSSPGVPVYGSPTPDYDGKHSSGAHARPPQGGLDDPDMPMTGMFSGIDVANYGNQPGGPAGAELASPDMPMTGTFSSLDVANYGNQPGGPAGVEPASPDMPMTGMFSSVDVANYGNQPGTHGTYPGTHPGHAAPGHGAGRSAPTGHTSPGGHGTYAAHGAHSGPGTADSARFGQGGGAAQPAGGGSGRPAPGIFGLLTVFTLMDGSGDAFDRLADDTVEAVCRSEPDTLIFACHSVKSAPLQRIVYEIYRDEIAYQDHQRQPHVERFVTERQTLVLATNVIEINVNAAKVVSLPTAYQL